MLAVELDDAVPLTPVEPARQRSVVLLGHEHRGVPEEVRPLLEIPMVGQGASLNVAVAGSLVLHRLAGLMCGGSSAPVRAAVAVLGAVTITTQVTTESPVVGNSLRAMAPTTMSELRERRDEIMEVARARGATRVRGVGSVARGDVREGSDLDFLVDLEPGRSLLDLGGLLMDLQDLLQRDVDVVTERGLRPRVAKRVLADAVEL